jgi:hypothetical protein
VQREIRHAELEKAVDRYLRQLDKQLGPATDAEKAEAAEWADRIEKTAKPAPRRRKAS